MRNIKTTQVCKIKSFMNRAKITSTRISIWPWLRSSRMPNCQRLYIGKRCLSDRPVSIGAFRPVKRYLPLILKAVKWSVLWQLRTPRKIYRSGLSISRSSRGSRSHQSGLAAGKVCLIKWWIHWIQLNSLRMTLKIASLSHRRPEFCLSMTMIRHFHQHSIVQGNLMVYLALRTCIIMQLKSLTITIKVCLCRVSLMVFQIK